MISTTSRVVREYRYVASPGARGKSKLTARWEAENACGCDSGSDGCTSARPLQNVLNGAPMASSDRRSIGFGVNLTYTVRAYLVHTIIISRNSECKILSVDLCGSVVKDDGARKVPRESRHKGVAPRICFCCLDCVGGKRLSRLLVYLQYFAPGGLRHAWQVMAEVITLIVCSSLYAIIIPIIFHIVGWQLEKSENRRQISRRVECALKVLISHAQEALRTSRALQNGSKILST